MPLTFECLFLCKLQPTVEFIWNILISLNLILYLQEFYITMTEATTGKLTAPAVNKRTVTFKHPVRTNSPEVGRRCLLPFMFMSKKNMYFSSIYIKMIIFLSIRKQSSLHNQYSFISGNATVWKYTVFLLFIYIYDDSLQPIFFPVATGWTNTCKYSPVST